MAAQVPKKIPLKNKKSAHPTFDSRPKRFGRGLGEPFLKRFPQEKPSFLKQIIRRENRLPNRVEEFFSSELQVERSAEETLVGVVGTALTRGGENARFEGEVAGVADVEETVHQRIEREGAEKGRQVGVGIAEVVLDVERTDVAAENAEAFVLRGFLHIAVTSVPAGVEERVVHVVDQRALVGGVIDPVHTVHTHLVEVFDEDVDFVLLREGEQLFVECLVPLERFFLGDTVNVAGVNDEIFDSEHPADFDTALRVLREGIVSFRNRCAHRGMRLYELYAQHVRETKEIVGVLTPVGGVGTRTVRVVRAEIVVDKAEAGFADVTDGICLCGGISGKISGGGSEFHDRSSFEVREYV